VIKSSRYRKGNDIQAAKTLNKADFDAAIDTAEREAIDKAFDNAQFSLAGYKCKSDCERRFAVNIGPRTVIKAQPQKSTVQRCTRRLSSLIGRWISSANVENREAEFHMDVLSEDAGYLTGVSFPVYSPPKFPSGKAQGRNVHCKSSYFKFNLLAGAFPYAGHWPHSWTQAGGAFFHHSGCFSRFAD
jgi:hypothetical protein